MRHALGGIGVVIAGILAAAGCARETFFCDTPEDCTSADGGGMCEETGYCSFPDTECETGRRYGELAPSGLAGTCVPQSGGTGTTTSTSDEPGTSDPTVQPGSTTGPDETSAATSDATTEPSTTDPSTTDADTSGSESSTGGEPMCCSSDCSVCDDACTSETFDSVDMGEALSLKIVDNTLIWSTGWSNQIITIDLDTGDRSILATLPHLVSEITTDGTHVYYLSYNSSLVRRVSLASGQIDELGDAEVGATSYDAGHGHITQDEDYVYAAFANTADEANGGVFRFSKAKSIGQIPLQLGALSRPIGIDVDDDAVYISDEETGGLYRWNKGAASGDPVQIAEAPFPGPLLVVDDDIYYTATTELRRVPKDGGAHVVLASLTGQIEGIAADETHIYITGLYSDEVMRVSRLDAEPPRLIATSDAPWGIVTDCNYVYWGESGTVSVQRQPK
jgi:hypothetical protein